jgi:hypothetical protein
MKIDLPCDLVEKIVAEDLNETVEMFVDSLINKPTIPFVSFDPVEESQHVLKMIDAFETVLSWYSVPSL